MVFNISLMDWLSGIFLMIMGEGEINLFKRLKNKESNNLEYLILKDNDIINISSDLNDLVKNISNISKKYGINKIVYTQKIPEEINGGCSYGCLSRDETKEIDKYIDKTKIFS
tara:strand:- start:110 stop:448 length:339 start_codon:yes stop_codon:yes gene_type:complete